MLEREPEWQRIYEDPVSVLYARRPGAGTGAGGEIGGARTAAVRRAELP